MATVAKDIASAPVTLTDNVYEQEFEFRGTVRMVCDMIDGKSSEETVRTAVEIAKDAVGSDPAKLYGLFDVVQDKAMSQWDWASSGAVTFYKILFRELDLDFLADDNFGIGGADGAKITTDYIVSKCKNELKQTADWRSYNIACMLEFVDKAFDEEASLFNIAATVGIVRKMAVSHYLFFDCYNNLAIFLDFCLLVIPRMQARDDGGAAEMLNPLFKNLTKLPHASDAQVDLIHELRKSLGWSDKRAKKDTEIAVFHQAIPVALHDLANEVSAGLSQYVFEEEINWGCTATARLINAVTHSMTIDAPGWVQIATCNVIDAMASSEMLFVGENFKTFEFFIMRVGPAVDGKASPYKSKRLTNALDALRNSPWVRTTQHRRDIETLRRNLGRTFSAVEDGPVKEKEVEEEEVGEKDMEEKDVEEMLAKSHWSDEDDEYLVI